MAAPRTWNIVLHKHGDGSFTARVSVGGKLLRPDCAACSADEAHQYVEAALLDAREDDQFVLRAQGHGILEAARESDAKSATAWLEARLRAMAGDASEGAKSGTRPIVSANGTLTEVRKRGSS